MKLEKGGMKHNCFFIVICYYLIRSDFFCTYQGHCHLMPIEYVMKVDQKQYTTDVDQQKYNILIIHNLLNNFMKNESFVVDSEKHQISSDIHLIKVQSYRM